VTGVRARLVLFPEKPYGGQGHPTKKISACANLILRGPTVSFRASGRGFDSHFDQYYIDASLPIASAESRPVTIITLLRMYAQRLSQRHVVATYRTASRAHQLRRLATVTPPPETPEPAPSSKPCRYEKAEPERSWLVQRIRANPFALKTVRALGRAMGYGSIKQVAGRRTLAIYEQVCAIKASEDRAFWQGECLPSERRSSPPG
jgi:hypothetical protein